MAEVRRLKLPASGEALRHPDLAVLVYRNALEPGFRDGTADFEAMFARNGWVPHWRGRLDSHHHYHVSAHEVVGFASGHAVLLLGGPGGEKVSLDAGDAVLLPAGTGHCQLHGSADLIAIGAYPAGQGSDLHDDPPSPETRARIAAVSPPERDPVLGIAAVH